MSGSLSGSTRIRLTAQWHSAGTAATLPENVPPLAPASLSGPDMLRHSPALLALLVFAFAPLAATAAEKPNIVFIFSDDHAYQAISAYDDPRKLIETPNIDRIAKEGMRFDRCLVPNSICGPSRATVLTGKYSHTQRLLQQHQQPVRRLAAHLPEAAARRPATRPPSSASGTSSAIRPASTTGTSCRARASTTTRR